MKIISIAVVISCALLSLKTAFGSLHKCLNGTVPFPMKYGVNSFVCSDFNEMMIFCMKYLERSLPSFDVRPFHLHATVSMTDMCIGCQ